MLRERPRCVRPSVSEAAATVSQETSSGGARSSGETDRDGGSGSDVRYFDVLLGQLRSHECGAVAAQSSSAAARAPARSTDRSRACWSLLTPATGAGGGDSLLCMRADAPQTKSVARRVARHVAAVCMGAAGTATEVLASLRDRARARRVLTQRVAIFVLLDGCPLTGQWTAFARGYNAIARALRDALRRQSPMDDTWSLLPHDAFVFDALRWVPLHAAVRTAADAAAWAALHPSHREDVAAAQAAVLARGLPVSRARSRAQGPSADASCGATDAHSLSRPLKRTRRDPSVASNDSASDAQERADVGGAAGAL